MPPRTRCPVGKVPRLPHLPARDGESNGSWPDLNSALDDGVKVGY